MYPTVEYPQNELENKSFYDSNFVEKQTLTFNLANVHAYARMHQFSSVKYDKEGAWYVLVPRLKVVGLKLANLTHAWSKY